MRALIKAAKQKRRLVQSLFLFMTIVGFGVLNGGSVRAETNPLNLNAYTYGTYYVYVAAGETFNATFTANSANAASARITVTGPGNTIYSPDSVGASGQSCPFVAISTVCTWTDISSASSGIWTVTLDTSPPSAPQAASGRHTWNITVEDGGGVSIDGRTYTPYVSLVQFGGNPTVPVWYVSPDGYQYEVRHMGYNGINSILTGDNVGVRQNATCLSGYRNFYGQTGYSIPPQGECGDPFKLFVSQPASDLPAQAPLPDGTMEWLAPAPSIPTVTSTTFTGNSITQRSGSISYNLSEYTGQYVVQVDTDNDGNFGGPNDVSITRFASGAGQYATPFDGRRADGSIIPATQDIGVRVGILKGGELHFSSTDVEQRGSGIEVKVLNGNSAGNFLNVYWNDSHDPGAETTCATEGHDAASTVIGDFSRAGAYSQGGVHTWGNALTGCAGQWGNNKIVDDWTYVPINAVQVLTVPGLTQSVRYHKMISPAVNSITPGQVFTYTIAAENTGDLPLTGVSLTDDLTNVVDDATYNADVSATSGSATFNGPNQITWSGDLAIDQTATVTYSVTMNDPITGDGQLRNRVVGSGPNSNCTNAAPVDPDCFTITPLPDITSQKTLMSSTNPQAGDVVSYQFTVMNNGAGGITQLAVADDLTGVLDDATYNNDANATIGIVAFDPTTRRLVWNGDLAATGAPDDMVTITYSVTLNRADAMGDGTLNNAVVSSDCPSPAIFDPNTPGYTAACVTSTPVRAWTATKTAAPSGNVQPGQSVTYTILITNTGAVDLVGAEAPTIDDDLTKVLDDAVLNEANIQQTVGSYVYSEPLLHWEGDLLVDQTATVTYSVTTNMLNHLGDGMLVNVITGPMNCPGMAVTDPAAPNYSMSCVTSTGVNTSVPGGDEKRLANTGVKTYNWMIGSLAIVGMGIFGLLKNVRRS